MKIHEGAKSGNVKDLDGGEEELWVVGEVRLRWQRKKEADPY